jgi:ribosomal protein S17E
MHKAFKGYEIKQTYMSIMEFYKSNHVIDFDHNMFILLIGLWC